MIGPRTKQMPDKLICTDCEVVISKTLGGTPRFRKTSTAYYCNHPELNTQVAFIKGFPYTPWWCPALKGRNLTSRSSRAANACVYWTTCDTPRTECKKCIAEIKPPPA